MRSRRQTDGSGAAPASSNLAGRDTALLEALWRGDELAAALRTSEAALAACESNLARAEETIAELNDIVDAAQAGLDELRARMADVAEAARNDRKLRDAVAAELYRIVCDGAPGWNVPGGPRYAADLRQRGFPKVLFHRCSGWWRLAQKALGRDQH